MKQAFTLSILFIFFLFACNANENGQQDNKSSVININPNSLIHEIIDIKPKSSYPDAGITALSYANGQFNMDFLGDQMNLGGHEKETVFTNPKGHHVEIHVLTVGCVETTTFPVDFPLKDGAYDVIAFVSTDQDICLKGPRSNMTSRFFIENGSVVGIEPLPYPQLLTNCSHDGTVSDEGSVQLDYFILNAVIGETHFIELSVNGEPFFISKWGPLLVNGFTKGRNSIQIGMRDKTGRRVNTPTIPAVLEFNM